MAESSGRRAARALRGRPASASAVMITTAMVRPPPANAWTAGPDHASPGGTSRAARHRRPVWRRSRLAGPRPRRPPATRSAPDIDKRLGDGPLQQRFVFDDEHTQRIAGRHGSMTRLPAANWTRCPVLNGLEKDDERLICAAAPGIARAPASEEASPDGHLAIAMGGDADTLDHAADAVARKRSAVALGQRRQIRRRRAEREGEGPGTECLGAVTTRATVAIDARPVRIDRNRGHRRGWSLDRLDECDDVPQADGLATRPVPGRETSAPRPACPRHRGSPCRSTRRWSPVTRSRGNVPPFRRASSVRSAGVVRSERGHRPVAFAGAAMAAGAVEIEGDRSGQWRFLHRQRSVRPHLTVQSRCRRQTCQDKNAERAQIEPHAITLRSHHRSKLQDTRVANSVQSTPWPLTRTRRAVANPGAIAWPRLGRTGQFRRPRENPAAPQEVADRQWPPGCTESRRQGGIEIAPVV